MGDGLLLEFASVVDATQCMIEVRQGMAARNDGIDVSRRIVFRVGVNLGDIIIDGDDILGDGVNIAARLQEIAAPGGVAISARVHEDIRDRLDTAFTDGGAQTLKEANPELRIAGVVPTDDPRIEWVRSRAIHKALENFGVPKLRFLIEDVLENNVMDKEITVENADAKNMADRLCREEGLYCGMSSGANVVAAIEMAKSMDKGSKIVTVIVDRRDRYSAEYPNEHYVV